MDDPFADDGACGVMRAPKAPPPSILCGRSTPPDMLSWMAREHTTIEVAGPQLAVNLGNIDWIPRPVRRSDLDHDELRETWAPPVA